MAKASEQEHAEINHNLSYLKGFEQGQAQTLDHLENILVAASNAGMLTGRFDALTRGVSIAGEHAAIAAGYEQGHLVEDWTPHSELKRAIELTYYDGYRFGFLEANSGL